MVTIRIIRHKETLFYQTKKNLLITIFNNLVIAFKLSVVFLSFTITLALVSLILGFFFPDPISILSIDFLTIDLISISVEGFQFIIWFASYEEGLLIGIFAGIAGGWIYSRIFSSGLVFYNNFSDKKNVINRYFHVPTKKGRKEILTQFIELLNITYILGFLFFTLLSVTIPLNYFKGIIESETYILHQNFLYFLFILLLSSIILLYFDRSHIYVKFTSPVESVILPGFSDQKIGYEPSIKTVKTEPTCPFCNQMLYKKYINHCPYCNHDLTGLICPICLLDLFSTKDIITCQECKTKFHKEEYYTYLTIYNKCPICHI